MSPATDGEVEGRSPFGSPLELVVAARSISNFLVAPAAGSLSFSPHNLNVPVPPDAVVGRRTLPVEKNISTSAVPMNSSADEAKIGWSVSHILVTEMAPAAVRLKRQ